MQFKLLLPPLLLVGFMVNAQGQLYQINDTSIRSPENLGGVHVLFDEDRFYLAQNDEIKEVQAAFVDPVLRKVNSINALDKYFKSGCKITIKQMEDGEFKLQSKVPGYGAGPISGLIAYWFVKGSVATVAVAGVTAAAAATGGAALGPLAVGAATAATAGASVGVAAAGATLAATSAAPVLATAAMGAATAGVPAVLAAAAAVETASLGAAAFFTAIPFLP